MRELENERMHDYIHKKDRAGDGQVLDFINNIYEGRTPEECEAIRTLFRAGYCYYFANMLKLAFGRGTVCLAYPFAHVVWADDDGTAYDAEGSYEGGCEMLVDIGCVPGLKLGFMHVPGLESPADIREQVDEAIKKHPEFIK